MHIPRSLPALLALTLFITPRAHAISAQQAAAFGGFGLSCVSLLYQH
jgi:hypothetical protein